MSKDEIAARLNAVRARIASAANRAGRDPGEIRILAVTKAHGKDAVLAGLGAGLTQFGENFAQEALAKIGAVGSGATWHFIGRLQSNKTRLVAEHFDWVHTAIRERIVLRLATQRPADAPPLNACIQVRMQADDARPALPPEGVAELAELIRAQPRLKLRGLMGMPMPGAPREAYSGLRSLFDRLNQAGMDLDTLSMGMTADLETAVECGATLVRVGTALFGPRPQR
ncbi:MAG: YggS family pyridoxal phosphate-dependent enzyme [Gammaproteobacteria bacterium]|nr:YggS family pyridoxal phosphate-dependent enzyme [Gammaproteobacteria bacterium]MDE0453761.1 YggS family pyridoxal phosphate-dependent enzyme [Gammaproteobacteria bacterium]